MDQIVQFVDPLKQFAKDSVRLVKRCTKPDKKGKNFCLEINLISVFTKIQATLQVTTIEIPIFNLQSFKRLLSPLQSDSLSWASLDFS